MNRNEKKIFAWGAAGGLSVAVLAIAILELNGVHAARQSTNMPQSRTAQTASSQDSAATQPGESVTLTPEEINAAGVQVAAVTNARLNTRFEAFGRVEDPETQLSTISARISGRVDTLYLRYTGEMVRRGAPVAELYSPEVATSLEEYRLAQDNRRRLSDSANAQAVAAAEALVAASRRKLELWGISAKQIEAGESAGTPHVTIFSSASGSVVERKVTRGQYVNAGDSLFTVADLSTVWIKADVYETQLPLVSPGQKVEITTEAVPDKVLRGYVEFVEPKTNTQTRTVPVHIHLPNPGLKLLPGMFVRASFDRPAAETLVVPRAAVMDAGTRKLVYLVKGDGVFEAREVSLGTPNQDAYPVLAGLSLGDKVVTNGNFLIDSQTRLSGSMAGMFGGSKQYENGAAANTARPAAKVTVSFSVQPDPPKGGAENVFRVALADAAGQPIRDAQVSVTLIMPAMPAMGMGEMRDTIPLAPTNGAYEGRRAISASGSWNVVVEAKRDGQTIATYRARLNAR